MYDDVLLPVAIGEVDDVDESHSDSSANQKSEISGDDPALDRALDLADQYDATLHLLSAVDPAVFDPMTVDTSAVHEALEESAADTVETAADRAAERGVDVETRVAQGPAPAVVTDYAENVDVVVMATHGREGLEHALLGSVTEKVVRQSPAPVLTVPR